jgi:hypothetical protein
MKRARVFAFVFVFAAGLLSGAAGSGLAEHRAANTIPFSATASSVSAKSLCPACKVIIDCGGHVAAATANFANEARATADLVVYMDARKLLSDEDAEYVIAWSALNCKRADLINKWAADSAAFNQKYGATYDVSAEYAIDPITGVTPKH